MEKQLFADIPPHLRKEMLEANAEKVEEMTYSKPLTAEELEKARMDFSQQAIEISQKQDALKEITDKVKSELKPMIDQNRSTLNEIKTRHRFVKEQVYHLADHEAGMMCTYNSMGELITSRRLTPEENQLTIHSSRSLRIAQND